MTSPTAGRRDGRTCLGAAAVVLLLVLPGCNRSSPTAPGPPRVAIEGTWIGTITDHAAGTARLSMTVSGIESLGVGTFTLTFPDASANARGILQGRTQNAPTIDLTLFVEAAGRDCPGTPGVSYFARLALSENRMTGTYNPAGGCPLLAGGSMELTRR